MGIVALVGVGALGFIGYQFYSFFFGISGTRSEREADMIRLHQFVTEQDVSPWDYSEVNLLSRFGESNEDRQLFGGIERGVIYSIYDEPIIAFATKHYSAHDIHLLCFRANDDVYSVELTDDSGSILKNKKEYADIYTHKGVVVKRGNTTLTIESHSAGQLIPVFIDDVQVVNINREAENDRSRVVVPLEPIETADQELFLVSLAFSVIDQHI